MVFVSRLQHLTVQDNQITFMGRPAVCFHVHTMKSLDYNNQGKFLVDKVFQLMSTTKNKKYGDLFAFVAGLLNEPK